MGMMEQRCWRAAGEWLIEVAVEQERRVPKDWHKVCSTKKVHRWVGWERKEEIQESSVRTFDVSGDYRRVLLEWMWAMDVVVEWWGGQAGGA